MAYEMSIRGTQDEVKVRNPWAVALLPFVTFGVYHLVWWYRVNRELRDYGRAKGYDLGQNPTASLLALFPGFLLLIPPLVSYWRGAKRMQGASRIAGQEPLNGWIALLLYFLLPPGLWAYMQVGLNDVWREEAEALPGQELPPAADRMPPSLADREAEGEPPGAPEQQPPAP